MALELAGLGVRVVCLRTAANSDSRTIQEFTDATAAGTGGTRQQALATLDRALMLTGTVHNPPPGSALTSTPEPARMERPGNRPSGRLECRSQTIQMYKMTIIRREPSDTAGGNQP